MKGGCLPSWSERRQTCALPLLYRQVSRVTEECADGTPNERPPLGGFNRGALSSLITRLERGSAGFLEDVGFHIEGVETGALSPICLVALYCACPGTGVDIGFQYLYPRVPTVFLGRPVCRCGGVILWLIVPVGQARGLFPDAPNLGF